MEYGIEDPLVSYRGGQIERERERERETQHLDMSEWVELTGWH